MQQNDTAGGPPISGRDWTRLLAPYREPSLPRSLGEIAVTLVPLVVLWIAAWAALGVGYWLTLLLTVPCAAFLVRMFMIQHDCGHGSLFRSKVANDWTGRLIGVLTLTPYDVWRRGHSIHHATSGHLDRRGVGDIDTLTVAEYTRLPPWRRFAYRLYRSPLVMFGLGPAYLFLLQHRLPVGFMRAGLSPWVSTMLNNLGIALLFGGAIWLVGLGPFLLVQVPVTLIASCLGVWLFYVQHQFEETYWAEGTNWTYQDAALYGSSHYDLPLPLRWLSANIGMHHVHHLYSRIPFYRLPRVLRDFPELADIRRITLRQSLGVVRLKLWDTDRRRLVSFAGLPR